MRMISFGYCLRLMRRAYISLNGKKRSGIRAGVRSLGRDGMMAEQPLLSASWLDHVSILIEYKILTRACILTDFFIDWSPYFYANLFK
jgi:hypothetical protein